MSTQKTTKTNASVSHFIDSIAHPTRKENSSQLLSMMNDITGMEPNMWGDSIIGYDEYQYSYASGRVGNWPMIGFSPRKQNLSIYIMPGFNKMGDLLEKLGKHRTSVSCLYINKLSDVDLEILRELLNRRYELMRRKY
ncbi:DUF1801 domain-containing protein [Dokdonia sp. Hel_I_53]|uniref:DUF1801 domain-containing protein n=1 Tax=Dokdonia sp. Hel_I_53 TaxID=1566287 RepID=UPI00119C6364|nr:DUF1801 domain-containing protein [Dokdonia sp. Hel_I_53]TVZ51555.1 uncharacterized protein DUF1801 [Dokdonia sp. Hel_I_53]